MNKKENIVIVGLSSTAEHVCHFIKEYDLFNIIGFAVDREYLNETTFQGYPVYAIDDLHKIINKKEDFLFVAMLWNKLNSDRRKVYERLRADGYKFANIISPTAKIRGELLGDNCWFHDYTIVQYGAKIGSDVMAMAFSLIGAHVNLGSHCFLGTKSTVAGGCNVGEQTFIGINSTIFDDRNVGEKCIVGACSVVKRDLPDFSVCKTSLENMTVKTYSSEIIESKLQFNLNKH